MQIILMLKLFKKILVDSLPLIYSLIDKETRSIFGLLVLVQAMEEEEKITLHIKEIPQVYSILEIHKTILK